MAKDSQDWVISLLQENQSAFGPKMTSEDEVRIRLHRRPGILLDTSFEQLAYRLGEMSAACIVMARPRTDLDEERKPAGEVMVCLGFVFPVGRVWLLMFLEEKS